MLDWNQQHPDEPTEERGNEGRISAPDRNCYVCGQRAWRWNEEKGQFDCASGDPAHPERERWLRDTFPDTFSQGEEQG